jgi:MFS transporter, DHA2 family, multidrug resistance protein
VPAVTGAAMLIAFVWHALRRTEKPMIDLRLLQQRVVATANAARFLFTVSYLGPLLIFPLYFQQVLGATPMRTGILLASQSVGAAVCSPVIGRITDRSGPRGVVLVGTVVSTAALGVFIWAIGEPLVPIAVFILALAMTGVGASAIMIPVASAAVHTLKTATPLIHRRYCTSITRSLPPSASPGVQRCWPACRRWVRCAPTLQYWQHRRASACYP